MKNKPSLSIDHKVGSSSLYFAGTDSVVSFLVESCEMTEQNVLGLTRNED